MAATKGKAPPRKGTNKTSAKSSKPPSSNRVKKSSSSKTLAAKPSEQKSKPTTTNLTKKKKPPHLRYTEKELKVPQLNGIRPAGVQKPPNRKKGKQFVDDGAGMRTILAMVMAEKEGNIESKIMRARQMEELREARKVEAEKRAEGKKAGLEERKEEIKQNKNKKKRRHTDSEVPTGDAKTAQKPKKKKVSFG